MIPSVTDPRWTLTSGMISRNLIFPNMTFSKFAMSYSSTNNRIWTEGPKRLSMPVEPCLRDQAVRSARRAPMAQFNISWHTPKLLYLRKLTRTTVRRRLPLLLLKIQDSIRAMDPAMKTLSYMT